MTLLTLGGPAMWALLLLSIAATAVVVERLFVFSSVPLPKGLTSASTSAEALGALAEPAYAELRAALASDTPDRERVTLAGDALLSRLEAHLDLLATLAKAATLLGLLGTVLGMIDTFSTLAAASGGVDLKALSEGLWQALLTTAAGLTIAIPASLFEALFRARVKKTADLLTLAANRALRGKPEAS